MKKGPLVLIVVLLCTCKSVLAQEEKVYCVKPTYYNVSGTETTNCSIHTKWASILFNASRYFTSYTKLYFLPGIYDLNRHLQINNITNFSIIGDEVFTIMCQANTSTASLLVSNSLFVEIRNIEFKNCKTNIKHFKFMTENNLLSTQTNAALFLYNVRSVKITNVNFVNSHCHSIVAFNVDGSLTNISIFYTYKKDYMHRDENITTGGFVLVYFDEKNDIVQKNDYKVLIDSCAIFNIQDVGSNTSLKILSDLHTSVIGIGFYQQDYFVHIKIFNITIENVSYNKGPIIMIIHNSINVMNSVHVFNSSFSEINNNEQPMISMLIISESEISTADFALAHCRILFNTVGFILHVQPIKNAHTKLNLLINLTEFANNKAGLNFWEVQLMKTDHVFVSISKSKFISNTGFTLMFNNVGKVTFIGNNSFYNNSVKVKDKAIIRCKKTLLMFEGYNEFSSNTANIIISLEQMYIGIKENTTMNFLQNRALTCIKSPPKSVIKSVIKFRKNKAVYFCPLQLFSKSGNLDQHFMNSYTVIHFNVTFKDNKNYNSTIFGTQMNSCSWDKQSAFKMLTPGYVYKKVLHFNSANNKIINSQGATFCHCENTTHIDCIKDYFGPIYPGQKIPISLKKLDSSYRDVLVERHFALRQTFADRSRCELVPLFGPSLIQVFDLQCTALLYKVLNKHNEKSCFVHFSTIGSTNNWYLYFIYFKTCPAAFDNYNGSCECNKQLKLAIPRLTCDIKTQSITNPGRGWIGLSHDKQNILYVKRCNTFCSKMPTTMQLTSPDSQCRYGRTGIMCGQCPHGFDAIFGSFNCKKCSNYWLLLIPAFMLAGILLVLSTFVLNLTVVDGKLNGFILYVNLIAGNSYNIYPSRKNIFFVLTSLFNLDLGIETCFYHGMTEYAKTWLQFAFPSYLLFIVVILTIASRYSSSVEKLTRRRVIPVIATIFLLTYNKLLLAIAKVLFSYRIVHSLPDNRNSIIWIYDSSMPLFELKFLALFTACLLIFLIILLPLNLLLLFTKFSYRFKFVAEYIRPYLDAYQAPFKSSCYYYFGIELLLRSVAFALGNRILDSYKTLAIITFLCLIVLLYICTVKPFKSTANTVLYASYIFDIACVILLVVYFNIKLKSVSYETLYNIFILIAFVKFGCTVFYYLYINHLHKIKELEGCFKRTSNYLLKCWNKFNCNKRNIAPDTLPLDNFEQLQEELLAIDPTR